MRKIYEFIVQNWELISAILVSAASVVLVLIKSRDKSKQFQLLEVYLEDMILLAEETIGAGKGDVKKELVMRSCKEFCKKVGLVVTDEVIADKIEKLLSLPKKK